MFGLFKSKKDSAETFLENFESSITVSYGNRNVKLTDNSNWLEINNLDVQTRTKVGFYALKKIIESGYKEYEKIVVRKKIFKQEYISRISELPKEELEKILKLFESIEYTYYLPFTDILTVFKTYKVKFGLDNLYIKGRNFFVNKNNNSANSEAEFSRFIKDLIKLDHDIEEEFCYDKADILGEKILSSYDKYSDEIKEIINFCWSEKQKTQPTKAWINQANNFIKTSKDIEAQKEIFYDYFKLISESGKAIARKINSATVAKEGESPCAFTTALNEYQKNQGKYYINEQNQVGISYLVWYCVLFNDAKLNSIIGSLALTSFIKIKWLGNLSDKNGNACLYAFTIMPNEVGIINLLNIRNKIVNKNVINLANNHIKRKAEALNLTEDALLELSTPDFNIENDKIIREFGDFEGIIEVSNFENLIINWRNKKKANFQKSVPKEVSENFSKELKEFQNLIKEISTAYNVHKTRIENTFINNISWSIQDWSKYYISHPFLSKFNSKLVWLFDNKTTAIKSGEYWIDENLEIINLTNFSNVRLWHPILSELNVIQKWRDFFFDNEIKQPFKQAYREIYKLTDAEIRTNTYSNRFAAHILYQHQFLALCKQRNWNYSLQGQWDSHNIPNKNIPAFNMYAEFWAEPVENSANENGIFNYVASDQVRYYTTREQINMELVPEMVFTETMRDIDMFVGVCSIGNNPEWQDGGEGGQYWTNYSFGELSTNAQTRKQVLQKIIPKLKIASICSFTDKYLEIKGRIRNYKIHLGSGNILMTPNDQYLCIVPDGRSVTNKIFLPFDDDRTLSIILSKAFLLADDDKITDSTIVRQISL